MNILTSPLPTPLQLLMQLAYQQITILGPEEVLAYIEQHHDLIPLLPLLCTRAQQEFGAESEVLLEVYHDPEIIDHHLCLIIRLPVYDEKTMDRIDRVWEPYEKELSEACGELYLTTDFRPPEWKYGVRLARVS